MGQLFITPLRRFWRGLAPSAPHRGHVHIAVRRFLVFQTRPDIRIRVRRIVIRIRVRHTAIRVRVVVAAIDHTGLLEAATLFANTKVLIYNRIATAFHQNPTGFASFLTVSSFLGHLRFPLSLCRTIVSLSRFPLCRCPSTHHATSLIALYAATLAASTIFPRKARRDPTLEFEYDAS